MSSPSLEDLRRRVSAAEGRSDRAFPTHPALRPLLGSRLQGGSVHCVVESTTLGLALLASATLADGWCATVGLPDISLEAAREWGVDLDRLLLVPHPPSADWADVVSHLVEAVDVVLACPPPHLPPARRARLEARLRHRGSVLVVSDAWPRAASVLHLHSSRWLGLTGGRGHVMAREMQVDLIRHGRSRRHTIRWPLPD